MLLVRATVVHGPPILVTLMKEALNSSEMSVLKEPHGVTSQKTPFFIVTAVKTSDLSFRLSLCVCKRLEPLLMLRRKNATRR
jgi:hypothetical protein